MNNSTANNVCPKDPFSPFFLLLATLSSVSAMFSIVGNSVVTWTVFKTKSVQCVSNLLIASLAVADGMVGLLLNPLLVVHVVLYSYQRYTDDLPVAFDEVEDFLWIQGLFVSTMSLTVISIDRYIAIAKGIYYHLIMTARRCKSIVIFVWLSPTVLALMRVVVDTNMLPWLWLTTIIVAVFFPLCISSYCYFKIFTLARVQAKKTVYLTNSAQAGDERMTNLKNTKAAKTMAIVIGVFFVAYSPSIVIACLHPFTSDQCTKLRIITTAWPCASLFAYSSSAINPWIYSIRSRAFRQAIRKVFKFRKRRFSK